jgi:RNA polymerase-binding protein DksA
MARDRNKELIETLKGERQQVLEDLEGLQEILKVEVDTDPDEGDADLVEREKAIALVANLKRRLESIDHALRYAERGTYGICERCGQPIDPARLEAVPETTLCVTCKAAVERQARMGGAPVQL